MQKKVIHVTTQEEYDKVMEVFDKKWWKWSWFKNIYFENKWTYYGSQTCINYDNPITYCYRKYFIDDWYEIISFQQFLQEEWISEKKPSRIKHTYTTTYLRDDGVQFTKDSIDWVSIDILKEQEKSHYEQARVIRAKLNAHSKLKF